MEAVKLKLLISIKSVEEALIVKNSKFDILDIKNPAEGSLGANFPGVIKEIIERSPNRVISAAGGDLPGLPGLSSQTLRAALTSKSENQGRISLNPSVYLAT